MKKGTQPAFMPPPDYGKALTGLGINLLSRDIDRALIFQREVLGVDLFIRTHLKLDSVSNKIKDIRFFDPG